MEDQRLYEATIQGNVDSLLKLIQEDALTLHRNNLTTFLENPLHIAVLLGHDQFAIELLRLKPDLASELDTKGSSPLHLASAKGNLEIVKTCFRTNPESCFACNRDGKNPVHVAAVRGRVDVLNELMRVKPEAGRAIVEQESKTILHLCVEYGQIDALKFLIESGSFEDLVNWKDRNGDTILHLAVSNKQVQITDFLLSVSTIDVSALNNNGMTAMDILMQRGRDIRDAEIEGSLIRARASITRDYNCANETVVYSNVLPSPKTLPKYKVKKPIKTNEDWLERKKSALMIVASLIATMAFQVGVNPSPNAWNTPRQETSLESDRGRITYFSNLIYNYFRSFPRFYMVNTMSFIASLSIILLLMSGLPLKNKLFMWILMVITWVAITALALSYTISVILLTPPGDERPTDNVLGVTMFIWLCLMALLLIGHTVRVLYRVLKPPIILTWKMIKGLKKFMVRRKVYTNRDNV